MHLAVFETAKFEWGMAKLKQDCFWDTTNKWLGLAFQTEFDLTSLALT